MVLGALSSWPAGFGTAGCEQSQAVSMPLANKLSAVPPTVPWAAVGLLLAGALV